MLWFRPSGAARPDVGTRRQARPGRCNPLRSWRAGYGQVSCE